MVPEYIRLHAFCTNWPHCCGPCTGAQGCPYLHLLRVNLAVNASMTLHTVMCVLLQSLL